MPVLIGQIRSVLAGASITPGWRIRLDCRNWLPDIGYSVLASSDDEHPDKWMVFKP